jgi:hypothetical protein
VNTEKPRKKREFYKEQEYFDNKVAYYQDTLAKFSEVASNPSTGSEHRTQLLYDIFKKSLEMLILRYSQGDDLFLIQKDFPQVVATLAAYKAEVDEVLNFGNFNNYIHALWLVSLAILTKTDDQLLNRLLTLINRRGQDLLFDRLAALRVPSYEQAVNVMYPRPYQPLLDALNAENEDKRIQLIGKFLEKYYPGMKRTYWYDNHLADNLTFFGYWCLELGAFVKMLKIPDEMFESNMYYPKDLVDF